MNSHLVLLSRQSCPVRTNHFNKLSAWATNFPPSWQAASTDSTFLPCQRNTFKAHARPRALDPQSRWAPSDDQTRWRGMGFRCSRDARAARRRAGRARAAPSRGAASRRRERARSTTDVLHHLCQVDQLAIDARLLQGAAEQLARRPHEGTPGAVLLIARLLTDEDGASGFQAFAEDGLRGVLVQVAGGAGCCGQAQLLQARLSARHPGLRLGPRHALKIRTLICVIHLGTGGDSYGC
jgi:hypothetical protein